MKKKYTINVNGDITSMASTDSQQNKFGLKDDNFNKFITNSERKSMFKNLIGNKLHKSNNSKDDETLTEQQKKDIEMLKKIWKGKRKIIKRKNKKKKLPIFSIIMKQKTLLHSDNAIFYKEIDKSIETFDKTKKWFLPLKSNLIN